MDDEIATVMSHKSHKFPSCKLCGRCPVIIATSTMAMKLKLDKIFQYIYILSARVASGGSISQSDQQR